MLCRGAVEKGVPLFPHGGGANVLLLCQVQALAVQAVVDSSSDGWAVA